MTGWAEQIVIVTGGSRGIGRAISRALAARGAAICINYATRAVEAEAAAGEIAATGGRVIAVQADVADADAVARMVARTEAELGPVSILVNNAGVSTPATLDSYDPPAMARMRRLMCMNSSTFRRELSMMTTLAASVVTSLCCPMAMPTVRSSRYRLIASRAKTRSDRYNS